MKTTTKLRRPRLSAAISLTATVMLVSACATAIGEPPTAPSTSLGPSEGSLRLLGLAGYVQDGRIDPRVDWVSKFEHQTRCSVSYTPVATPGEILGEFRRQNFDGVVAPPVVAGQLISTGRIAPLNGRLIPGYTAISPVLRAQPAVMSRGSIYGLPYLWSSYLLGYGTRSVRPPPRTWAALFDPRSAARHAGKITLPDTPLTIALAALYLRSARPALHITDPYELTRQQFDAATGLLKRVRPSITRYYWQNSDVIAGLASGSTVLGAVLPRQVEVLMRAGRQVAGIEPAQGTTGSADFWLMNARARHPNCLYRWLAWSITPGVQQQAAAWNGIVPVNPAACGGFGRQLCRPGHVGGRAFLSKVAFAHIPRSGCGNGRQACAAWTAWINAWRPVVRGAPR